MGLDRTLDVDRRTDERMQVRRGGILLIRIGRPTSNDSEIAESKCTRSTHTCYDYLHTHMPDADAGFPRRRLTMPKSCQ